MVSCIWEGIFSSSKAQLWEGGEGQTNWLKFSKSFLVLRARGPGPRESKCPRGGAEFQTEERGCGWRLRCLR